MLHVFTSLIYTAEPSDPFCLATIRRSHAPARVSAMAAPPSYAQAQAQAQPATGPKFAQMGLPLTLFPAYAARGPETLVVKSASSWTDGKYMIDTIDGRPIFQTDKGEGFSFSYRRRIFDARSGAHLFTVKRESRAFQPTIYHALGPSEAGARLFECEFDPWAEGERCSGHFVNPTTGAQERFLLKGNWLQSKATVSNQVTGQSVAEMKKESWKLKTGYHIAVAPGGDMALIVALCIIMHDRQESHASSGGGGG